MIATMCEGKLQQVILGLLVAFAVVACGPATDEPGDIDELAGVETADCAVGPVETTKGPVCGTTVEIGGETSTETRTETGGEAVEAFLGIPFAESTAGANRWRAPVPPAAWTTPLQATEPGPICPQGSRPGEATSLADAEPPQSEDCLSVNLWRPPGTAEGSDLPVAVFIYGGAFIDGASANPLYSGAPLAASQDLVVVSFNYRLGVLGFLGGIDGLAGNYGFLDQQAALRWVRDNVAAFGGDPEQVMLFGESAGAMSTGLHAFSAPESRGLFRAFAMESNPLGLPYKTLSEAGDVAALYAAISGCLVDRVECLRGKSVDELLDTQAALVLELPVALQGLSGILAWTPVVDGTVVTEQPAVAAAGGAFDLPGLLGTNRNEGIVFVFPVAGQLPGAQLSAADYVLFLDLFFGIEDKVEIVADPRYAVRLGKNNAPQMSAVVTDYLFLCANRHAARAARAPAFLYRFDQVSSFNFWPSIPACAGEVCHADELPYVFDTAAAVGFELTPAEQALADEMGDYWGSFTRALAPAGTVAWPAHGAAGKIQILQEAIETRDDPFAAQCALWDSIGYDLGNVLATAVAQGEVDGPAAAAASPEPGAGNV